MPRVPEKYLSDVGEFGLVDRLAKTVHVRRGIIGIGDDTAVLPSPDPRKYLLLTTDMMVEGVHFTRAMGAKLIGRKAMACNLSDIAAMGGDPLYAVVSLAVPPRVPLKFIREVYAGMHHEKLNGAGYPRGLGSGAIPLPARMLALADVLEALTAADRPYKQGKMLSEAMSILEGMVGRGDLDGDICDLVVESGLIARFSHDLSERQRNDFFWRGKRYGISETR